MLRNLGTAAAIMLIVLSATLVVHPFTSVGAQTQGAKIENEFTNVIPVGRFNSTSITVTSPSIIEYSTDSNVSIYTAFMDQQELDSFRQPADIANSIFYQQGTVNYGTRCWRVRAHTTSWSTLRTQPRTSQGST